MNINSELHRAVLPRIARRATEQHGPGPLPGSVAHDREAAGAGEYSVDLPGETPPGHFGLAIVDYGYCTAPIRRYPDLITQRLPNAAIEGATSPYGPAGLTELAGRRTQKEDDANKVERPANCVARGTGWQGWVGWRCSIGCPRAVRSRAHDAGTAGRDGAHCVRNEVIGHGRYANT